VKEIVPEPGWAVAGPTANIRGLRNQRKKLAKKTPAALNVSQKGMKRSRKVKGAKKMVSEKNRTTKREVIR